MARTDFTTRFWDTLCMFSNEFLLILRLSVLMLVLSLFSLMFVDNRASLIILQVDFLVVGVMLFGSSIILYKCRQW